MKKIFAYLTLGFTTLTTYAATPLWMRDIQISPDGTEIVFCYKGDIYKVSAKGGTATQLTTQESYESSPVWSPDGKQILIIFSHFVARNLTCNNSTKYCCHIYKY